MTTCDAAYINLDTAHAKSKFIQNVWPGWDLRRVSPLKPTTQYTHATNGEISLHQTHWNILRNWLHNSTAPNLLVLEDDADPVGLSKLTLSPSPLSLSPSVSPSPSLFLERLVLPRQYPPLLTNAFLVPSLLGWGPYFGTTVGVAGSGAVLWRDRRTAEAYVESQQSRADGGFHCKPNECPLDMGLNNFARSRGDALASLFPPLVQQVTLKTGSSIRTVETSGSDLVSADLVSPHLVSADLVHWESNAVVTHAAMWVQETALDLITQEWLSRSPSLDDLPAADPTELLRAVRTRLADDTSFARQVRRVYKSTRPWRLAGHASLFEPDHVDWWFHRSLLACALLSLYGLTQIARRAYTRRRYNVVNEVKDR